LNYKSIPEILEAMGCNGVMSGCGLLRDPTLFGQVHDRSLVAKDDSALWKNGVKIATEYIDLAIQY
jgi:tRNA-dihydrouridine synthase